MKEQSLAIMSKVLFDKGDRTIGHYLTFKSKFDALNLTEPEQRTLSGIYAEQGSPISLVGYLVTIRPETEYDDLVQAAAYLMAAAYTKNPLPPAYKCTKCVFAPYCPRNHDTSTNGCQVFYPDTGDIQLVIKDSFGHILAYDRGVWAYGMRSYKLNKTRYVGSFEAAMKFVKVNFRGKISKLPRVENLLLYGIRPNKGESYGKYLGRINAVVDRIKARFEEAQKPEAELTTEEKIKIIFTELGHADMLANTFGGNVLAMARAFFPGKTPSAIVAQFSGENLGAHKITSKEVYEEIKAEKEAAHDTRAV